METETKIQGVHKSSANRKVQSDVSLHQETRKPSNKQSDLTTRGTRKKEQ